MFQRTEQMQHYFIGQNREKATQMSYRENDLPPRDRLDTMSCLDSTFFHSL
jgi:hypothetical protein